MSAQTIIDQLSSQLSQASKAVEPSITMQISAMAQEMKKAFEPASPNDENAVDDKGNPIMMGVSRERIVPVLVKSIQELSAKNDALETKIKALESNK